MKLTLLRHAQTEGSLRNLYYGAADIPALPESLSELHRRAGDYPTAQRYYTSGMLRTEQTLAAIYVGLQLFGLFGFLLGPIGLLIIKDFVEEYGDEDEGTVVYR